MNTDLTINHEWNNSVNVQKLDKLTEDLNRDHSSLKTLELLDVMINEIFKNKITLVSSFGTEAALLLALTAEVNPSTPVIFLDTLKHFPETLEYRDKMIERLKLTDVRSIKPEPSAAKSSEAEKMWETNPDGCCYIRKVLPLEESLLGFEAWINGRKRLHGGLRSDLDILEHDGRRIKVNAIANWTPYMIDVEWKKRDLPEHPLIPFGYTSVGCQPCTVKPNPGEGPRSGRWEKFSKQECGIHNDKKPGGYDAGL
ncbi:MAG: phosphoadenosine phosphosulfate reductase [Micavibrio sp.]|nr:MAG: phosphoadenosine phosphosulfate reductase [Micavibrio sp.]